jgi:hypothetical protein
MDIVIQLDLVIQMELIDISSQYYSSSMTS